MTSYASAQGLCDGIPTYDPPEALETMILSYDFDPQTRDYITRTLDTYGGPSHQQSLKTIMQQEQNRKHRLMEGKKAVWANISRTSVTRRTKSGLVASASTPQQTKDLLIKLKEMGVEDEAIFLYQVEITNCSGLPKTDKAAHRGGFTAKERQVANKVSVGVRTYSEMPGMNGRSRKAMKENRMLPRPFLPEEEKGATILLDAKVNTVAVVFHNYLEEEEIISRKAFISLSEESGVLGWCKSCGLSGITNTLQLWKWICSRVDVRVAYFGKSESAYTVLEVHANGKRKGACSSHKLSYINRQGKTKMFQIGNHIFRHIFSYKRKTGNPLRSPEVKPYESAIIQGLKNLNPFLLFTSGVNRKESTPHELDGIGKECFCHAVNRYEYSHPFPGALHQDKVVNSVCCVSAFVEGGILSSANTVNAESGQLFIEYGSLLLPYGLRDCIFFCGNSFHCPIPPNPCTDTISENRKRKQDSKPILQLHRYSIASFLGKI